MGRGARIVTFVPLVAVAVVVYEFTRPPWSTLRVAGLVIAIVGLTLLTVARLQLGNSFSFTPQAKQLVTHGLYSRIRNPIYLFSAIGLAGLFVFIEKPYLLLLLLIVISVQLFRARAEGRVLEEHFGEQYRQYKAGTWF